MTRKKTTKSKSKPRQAPDEQPAKEAPPAPLLPIHSQDLSEEEYRQVLLKRIDEIDKAKRDLKAQVKSKAVQAQEEHVIIDQDWLRGMKETIERLNVDREQV